MKKVVVAFSCLPIVAWEIEKKDFYFSKANQLLKVKIQMNKF
jgi:hypothetical protein